MLVQHIKSLFIAQVYNMNSIFTTITNHANKLPPEQLLNVK